MKTFLLIIGILFIAAAVSTAQITSAADGNWSASATWSGGVVPTENDDVVIANTVSIDIPDAKCKNLTVSGNLYFAVTDGNGITIYGNTVVEAGKRFRMASATPSSGTLFQTIDFKGDLTVNSTGTFDMRQTSSAIGSVGRVIFSGTKNSIISLALTTYTSTTEEFNSVEINKTGGAKVILAAGNLYQNNNTSNIPDTLILTSGIVETQGTSVWAMLRTSSAGIAGGSSSSYFTGKLGLGITNSGSNSERTFPVGDGNSYRPINVRCQGPANSTGHYVWVQHVAGDANNGTSTFTGGIDKVSQVRYYEVGYTKGSAAAMALYGFSPTYSNGDGVNAGNMDLRVAYSTDARTTWNGVGPTTDTTRLSSEPQPIASDSIAPSISVADGASMFVAIARATGTTTNPLEPKVKAPQFSVSASTINFSTINANGTKKDSVIITNIGDDTLKISSIASSSTDFIVLPTTMVVAPLGTGRVYVTFAPTTVGTKSGKITLTHNASTSPDSIILSGISEAKIPVYSVNKKSLSFGVLQINKTLKDSVIVSNTGNDTLKITSIVSTLADFVVLPPTLTIAPSGSGKIFITFAPATVGPKNGKVILTHNAANGSDTLTMSGTGNPITSVRNENSLPTEFTVHQNYPNPFNPSTSIAFDMPEQSRITVEIFSILGNLVETLVNGTMNAGYHEVQWNASSQPSGIYFYRVTIGTKTLTNKMMLLK